MEGIRKDGTVTYWCWQRRFGDHWSFIEFLGKHQRKDWQQTASGEIWQEWGLHGFVSEAAALKHTEAVLRYVREDCDGKYADVRLVRITMSRETSVIVSMHADADAGAAHRAVEFQIACTELGVQPTLDQRRYVNHHASRRARVGRHQPARARLEVADADQDVADLVRGDQRRRRAVGGRRRAELRAEYRPGGALAYAMAAEAKTKTKDAVARLASAIAKAPPPRVRTRTRR